jgi:hypothetical protein
MTVAAALVAQTATVANAYGIAPQTVVALPPSDLDPAADEMRLRINGVEYTRQYDAVMEQP